MIADGKEPEASGEIESVGEIACTKWEPKEEMRGLLNVAQANNYRLNIGEMCSRAGLSRGTWYNWTHESGFMTWWDNERKRHWAALTHRVESAAYDAAVSREGVAADRKLYFERVEGDKSPEGLGGGILFDSGGAPIQVNISMDVVERMKVRAKELKARGMKGLKGVREQETEQ